MHVTETQRGKEFITQPVSAKKAKKKGYKSILDRFLNSLRYRVDIGWTEEHCARYGATASDVKRLGCLCSTAQVRTAKLSQDFIPVSKFDSDQVNHSPGTMKALSVSTQRRGWRWYPSTASSSSYSSWWQSSEKLWQAWCWDEPNHLKSQCQGVSLCNGDSLVSDGRCQHYTKPTHTSHSRTRDFFSRGSRLESSSQQESLCLTKTVILHI